MGARTGRTREERDVRPKFGIRHKALNVRGTGVAFDCALLPTTLHGILRAQIAGLRSKVSSEWVERL